MKNYYELLDVPPTASTDEIKRAFRREIASYHPDKVQHLGKEFQEIAAVKAAELTQAYKTLTDGRCAAEYDRDARGAPRAQPRLRPRPAGTPPAAPPRAAAEPPAPPASAERGARHSASIAVSREHARASDFVRKATVGTLPPGAR